MAVTLGPITFDAASTSVHERHEEVGGRRERSVEIAGVLAGHATETAIHDALDVILAAASTENYEAELSVRPGRRMFVRRAQFARDVSPESLTGSFVLKLDTRDPFEESTALHSVAWPVNASGATLNLSTAGNAPARLIIRLTAADTIVNPSFTDGARTISYSGTLLVDDEMVFDGDAGSVTLNGADVLPYVTGDFPQIGPVGITLTYVDDAASSHDGDVVVEYRDRWW